MGTVVKIDNKYHPAAAWSIVEQGIPVYAGDTSGGVGQIIITIPRRLQNENGTPVTPNQYKDKMVEIVDTQMGRAVGKVVGVSEQGAFTVLDCIPRLSRLAIKNIKADPFGGNLLQAFNYYLDLAKVPSGDRLIDPRAADHKVALPGWYGEVWTYMKQLATAFHYDINSAGPKIVIERHRRRTMEVMNALDKSTEWSPITKSEYVEVNQYESEWTTSAVFYPINVSDDAPITLKAGEQTQTTINLAGSAKELKDYKGDWAKRILPKYVEDMPLTQTKESQYVATHGNGTRVKRSAWAAGGGRLVVQINPDTQTATVTGVGPIGIKDSKGNLVDTFNIAIESGGITYNALRIRGRGTLLKKSKHRIATGIPATDAETEVGASVDNIFLNDVNQRCLTAVDAATLSSGGRWTLRTTLNSALRNSGSNVETGQVIGTVGGLRFWDDRTNSFYRVRKASVTTGRIEVTESDSDNAVGDYVNAYGDMTYGEVDAMYADLTYEQVRALGLPKKTTGILGE